MKDSILSVPALVGKKKLIAIYAELANALARARCAQKNFALFCFLPPCSLDFCAEKPALTPNKILNCFSETTDKNCKSCSCNMCRGENFCF